MAALGDQSEHTLRHSLFFKVLTTNDTSNEIIKESKNRSPSA